MTYSRDLLVAELERDEGNRGDVYDDATGKTIVPGYTMVGNPTTAVGRNLSAEPLSQPEINLLRDNSIAGKQLDLDHALPWWRDLGDVRQRALMGMCFNLGLPNLLKFQKMLAALKAGDWKTASAECPDSDAARKLPIRYGRYAAMIETGRD